MLNALITGVGGFVGVGLEQHLTLNGWQAYGLDLRSVGESTKYFLGDISDRGMLKRSLTESNPQVIFHLAGIIKSDQPEKLYLANLVGTVALFEAVMEFGIRPVIVVASSSAVYGHTSGARPVSEKMQLHPVTHYAVSKMAQEAVALRYYESFKLPVKIVRMFNLLGPGQPADLACSAFARQIALAELRGENEIVTGNLEAQRDFVDVRDAVRAFTLIAEKGKAGQVYNVCSGRAVTLRQCLDEMLSMSPRKFTVRMDEDRIQKNDIPIQVGSAQKLNQITGWHPQISLRESLQDLLNDWRERVKSGVE